MKLGLAPLWCALAGLIGAAQAANEPPTGPILPRDSAEAAVFRGSLVFTSYCATCHGINADGQGRAARLYDPRPANLRKSDKNAAYIELIVRKGGGALARSPKMPPWEEELTNEQIGDVVAYVRSVSGH